MRFSLRTLMLAVGVIPPAAWLVYWVLFGREPDDELQWPEPLGVLGVVSWLAIYYYLVHKRLPADYGIPARKESAEKWPLAPKQTGPTGVQ